MKPEPIKQVLLLFSMALAINTIDGQGFSNEECHKLLPKKSNAVFVVHYMVKAV